MKYIILTLIFSFSCFSQKIYQVIDKKRFEKHAQDLDLESIRILKESEKLLLVETTEYNITKFSDMIHEKEFVCGAGSTFFDEARAIEVMNSSNRQKGIQSILMDYSISRQSIVNPMISKISESHFKKTIEEISSYYSRYFRSPTGVDGSEWILNKWRKITKSRDDTEVVFFHHPWSQPSVVAKLKGSSDKMIVIGGHLDSKNYTQSVGHAPGADDDASGIATMTEVLKVLVESNYKPEHTLVFVGYAAEEDGLLGSADYVNYIKGQNKEVLGVIQMDMTLYNNIDDKIYVITDFTNNAQNNFVKDLIIEYIGSDRYAETECGYGCSDHASWTNQGYPASFPFESSFNGANPTIHTTGDTLHKVNGNVDKGLKFIKLGISFMVELDK